MRALAANANAVRNHTRRNAARKRLSLSKLTHECSETAVSSARARTRANSHTRRHTHASAHAGARAN
eukprot:11216285-Lingulodinium_polyedra.AAC.1